MMMKESARHEALRFIRDEHRSLAAVLHALQFLVKKLERGEAPDWTLLGSIIHYLIEFPERLHHPAEDRLLFEPLRRKTSEAADVLDRLQAEHEAGEERAVGLSTAMSQLAANAPDATAKFVAEIERYATFYWAHMSTEETIVLPLAERHLTEDDWARAAQGFRANHDPMFGGDTADEFEALFKRIVRLAPPPIGLGASDG